MATAFQWDTTRTLVMGVLVSIVVTGCSMSRSDGHKAFERRWHTIHGQQPAGLSFKLALPKQSFYQGEVIEATLTFANASTNSYTVDTRAYDRSGRLTDISFVGGSKDGESVPDPLGWYYTGRCFIGGGLSGGDVSLGEWSITLPANQWLRFDTPGRYRLYAWSGRAGAELVSDIVEVEITPLTLANEKRILAEAEADLSKGGEVSKKAVVCLRYLQTPAARKALLRLLSREDNFEAQEGVLSAPDPTKEAGLVLAAAKEPDVAVRQSFFWIYGALRSFSAQKSATGGVREVVQTIQDSMKVAQAEFAAEVRAQLLDKKGPALITSALTLLFQNPADKELRSLLVERREELTGGQILQIIDYWESCGTNLLGGADLMPILRMAVQPPRADSHALALLSKLAPDEARPIILEDIARDNPRFVNPREGRYAVNAFTALPDDQIPEFDAILKQKLRDQRADLFLVMPLIARYASPDLLPDVIEVYTLSEGKWACDIQNAALRYWIRCDVTNGVNALRRALKARADTGCYHGTLSEVLLGAWADEAIPLLHDALNDDDVEVVESAARVLERKTSLDEVPHVIEAIGKLNNAQTEGEENTRSWRADSLTRLLLNSKRWKLTHEQLDQLAAMARNQQTRQLIDSRIKGNATR